MTENFDNRKETIPSPLENRSYTEEVRKKSNISLLVNTIIILLIFLIGFLLFAIFTIKKPAYKSVKTDEVVLLPWDPIDWFSLQKNPLFYKHFEDSIFDLSSEYSIYVKHPKKVGIEVNQKYFDTSLNIIKKYFVNNTNDQLLIKNIEKELNKLAKEIKKQNPKAKVPEKINLLDLNLQNDFFNQALKRFSIDTDKNLIGYAILKGLFEGTNDIHSFVLGSEEYSTMMERLEDKSFGGIGVYIEQGEANQKMLMIVEAIEGTPAYKAGLQTGDIIAAINGHTTKNVDINLSMSRIRGKKGTSVKLDIIRNKKNLVFNVIRDDIKITSVSHKMLKNSIGYIRVRQFATNTISEFTSAIEALNRKTPMKGVIIDLRNNSGGFLEAGLALSGMFLPPDSIVMKKMERKHEVSSFYGGLENRIKIPVIVLTNRFSASASEIMAAALKENETAILVGEKTYGKGSVQQLFNQADGSAIKVTVAYFMSPKGHLINKKGVTPNILIEMQPKEVGKKNDIQLQKAEELISKK